MSDPTESIRREMVHEINEKERTKDYFVAKFGQENVWDTGELIRDFTVHSFLAPFCFVRRKSDGKKGVVTFQHHPRVYFNFEEWMTCAQQ